MVEARKIIVGMIRCPLPIVAAVNGPAVGLGCSLALLSDLVLIAEDTYLSDPHLQVGLVAGDGGALVLPLLVGLARAKELLFLGDRVSAQDAVRPRDRQHAPCPRTSFWTRPWRLARRLAALPAQALQDTKRAVNMHLEQAMPTVMETALAGRAGQHALRGAHRDRREDHRAKEEVTWTSHSMRPRKSFGARCASS